jgi:hypothetical protein
MPNVDKSHPIFSPGHGNLSVWIIILIFPMLVLCWLLIAPVRLNIDTRIPEISFQWMTVGKAKMVYEDDKWRFKISVLFFFKQWEVKDLFFKPKKKTEKQRHKAKSKYFKWVRKLLNVIKTFRVTNWQIAVDTGDNVGNAWLYSLNFYPAMGRHFHVNFFDESYLLLELRNAPWKMVYALIK